MVAWVKVRRRIHLLERPYLRLIVLRVGSARILVEVTVTRSAGVRAPTLGSVQRSYDR
jgi:hypothetical protein